MLPTKFWFIWESGFRGEDFFRNQPVRNKNCLWRPCLLTDHDEMSYLYRGPPRMLLTKCRFIWPNVSEEKIFCIKSANQKQELSVAAMSANGSGENEQSLYRNFHRC